MSSSNGTCLVAHAVSCSLGSQQAQQQQRKPKTNLVCDHHRFHISDIASKMQVASDSLNEMQHDKNGNADHSTNLIDKLSALSVADNRRSIVSDNHHTNANNDNNKQKNNRFVDAISPADFVTLQSLRSSALARKTNTTSKNNRGGAVLFTDLINCCSKKGDQTKEATVEKMNGKEICANTNTRSYKQTGGCEKWGDKGKKDGDICADMRKLSFLSAVGSDEKETVNEEQQEGKSLKKKEKQKKNETEIDDDGVRKKITSIGVRNSVLDSDKEAVKGKTIAPEHDKESPERINNEYDAIRLKLKSVQCCSECQPQQFKEQCCDDMKHEEEILLSRGPVRSSRFVSSAAVDSSNSSAAYSHHNHHHPYTGAKHSSNTTTTTTAYGTAPQTAVDDYSVYNGYGSGYECGNSCWADSPEEDKFGGYLSSDGSSPATSCILSVPYENHSHYQLIQQHCSPVPFQSSQQQQNNKVKAGVNQSLEQFSQKPPRNSVNNQPVLSTGQEDLVINSALLNVNLELPDALSDFILKYSRRYSVSSSPNLTHLLKNNTDINGIICANDIILMSNNINNNNAFSSSPSRKSSGSESFDESSGSTPKHLQRPPSTDSGCDSPMSAGSAPQHSPAAPRGTTLGPPTPDQFQSQTGVLFHHQSLARKMDSCKRTAKDKLRSMISDNEMSEAWAWTCKCVQYFPGALCYQDTDRDSLLHIVTLHTDLAKIYALVEQMLKTEFPPTQKPFDMPNRFHETPLFLAVQKRCVAIVEYLLEAGAYPNVQTQRPERDAPLHYAAARGMTEIVETLCANRITDVNLVNGLGLTPLLCAVKNHGVIEEERQTLLDNKPVINALLKCGADPLITDATNGKTVIHYAVERMDPDLIEVNNYIIQNPKAYDLSWIVVFRRKLDEETMAALVNQVDLCHETPIATLQNTTSLYQQNTSNSEIRSTIFFSLITCGAVVNNNDSRIGMNVNAGHNGNDSGNNQQQQSSFQ
ncbi:unnamed protein product [Anisakis simplex]|uniref:ANK_REP_REGION domain-containing protein n=1 Tax=Anisakis simplex TaxID=6269 RepID=A0A0M3K3H5_ANISI|nr:unnamed protein product [Anisakis simplex]